MYIIDGKNNNTTEISRMGETFLETALIKSFISKSNTLGNGYRICVATGKRGSCPDSILRFAQNPTRSVNT